MRFLSRVLPPYSGGDSGECDVFDHEYGPWTDFRWERRVRTEGDDAVVVKLGYELERTCRDCGDVDRMWRPSGVEIEVGVEWWHGMERGSKHNHGKPIFHENEVTVRD